jgi:hypothetical protein
MIVTFCNKKTGSRNGNFEHINALCVMGLFVLRLLLLTGHEGKANLPEFRWVETGFES